MVRLLFLIFALGTLARMLLPQSVPSPLAHAQDTSKSSTATDPSPRQATSTSAPSVPIPSSTNRAQADASTSSSASPMPAAEAAATMQVPTGFHVTLFAGEPDVCQPIASCIDDRGRLWVAEAYNYPQHTTESADRIVILEDTDGDGRLDHRQIFYEGLNYVTGIEVGFGGAWVMSPPFFFFIPDRNGDDRPDAEPELLLDGFGTHANAHNLANHLAWGPDGWLYGTHGRTNWSMVGSPQATEAERTRFDGGVYRYHPLRRVWEPYADGTTNPWGIDWNDYGEAFISNCVNPHLFHVLQGAHYEPGRNRETSRYAYERIPTIADHLHYLGGDDYHAGIGHAAEDQLGGGHAHCGIMVYLGDNWPDEYRNTVFMNNIHGRRINNDTLRRFQSGYKASHAHDFLRAADPWFVGVTLQYGHDGGVFVSDWSDTGECHHVTNTQRTTGRIYKITFGASDAPDVNIATCSTAELVTYQLHKNDWYVRHARRNLQERAARGEDMSDAHRQLRDLFGQSSDTPRRLRALWALHVTGGLTDAFLMEQLHDHDEYMRSWAIRLLCEDSPPPDAIQVFRTMAAEETSPFVRLYLASSLQRLSPDDRWSIAEALVQRVEDANDPYIPLMLWYGIEPLIHHDSNRFLALARVARIPLIRRHIAKRMTDFDAGN